MRPDLHVEAIAVHTEIGWRIPEPQKPRCPGRCSAAWRIQPVTPAPALRRKCRVPGKGIRRAGGCVHASRLYAALPGAAATLLARLSDLTAPTSRWYKCSWTAPSRTSACKTDCSPSARSARSRGCRGPRSNATFEPGDSLGTSRLAPGPAVGGRPSSPSGSDSLPSAATSALCTKGSAPNAAPRRPIAA